MTTAQIEVTVAAVRQVAPSILEFTLTPTAGTLPAFSPGSHIVVEMPDAQRIYRNAYSLLSDPNDTSAYRIGVRLQAKSRGGSHFMHTRVKPGDELKITPPANLFSPDWRARTHILLAGGVGITPFMSYVPALHRRGADFELHHLFRSTQTGAYHADLSDALGERYFAYDSAVSARCSIEQIMSGRAAGTHLYVCGPRSLLDAVMAVAVEIGWPASHLHFEAFAAPEPGSPFVVELNKSQKQVDVGPDESLLEALEGAGVEVPNLCRGGVCGQCVTTVISGEVEHRDHFLSTDEKASQTRIMPCVSRACGERLVIDL